MVVPWLPSSANKVQTYVFCCCLIVNYGVTLHRTCYTIVCIIQGCLAVYKTSTALIQSIGFTITVISFCYSELLISFACDLWVRNVRFTGTFIPPPLCQWHGILLGLIFGLGIFLGFAGSPKYFFGS